MGILRGLITLSLLLSFLAIAWWALRGANKSRFEALAYIPLEDAAKVADADSNGAIAS